MHSATVQSHSVHDGRSDAVHTDADAQAILEHRAGGDPSLEQVREILFGAENRRSESERKLLEAKVAERFARLEADCERRFDMLTRELQQRFDNACVLLEAEAAERRNALQSQYDELVTRLETAAKALAHAKTDREHLAALLIDVAERLRAATA